MRALTSWQELAELADLLDRQENLLRDVLCRLRREVEASHGYWRGAAGDTFRSHTGAQHRQRHLEVACARLHRAARLARAAAEENRLREQAAATGGTPYEPPAG